MSRTISTAFRRELFNPNSDVWGLIFLELSNSNLATSICVVNDITQYGSSAPIPYVFNGKTYTPYPFQLALLNDSDDIPETQIKIQNVDRAIGQAVLSLPADSPLQLSLSVYMSSDFTPGSPATSMIPVGTPTLQYQCPKAFIRNVQWDASSMTGTVRLYDPSKEPFPYLRATPDVAPGLFMS